MLRLLCFSCCRRPLGARCRRPATTSRPQVGTAVHEIGYPYGRPKELVDGEVLGWAKHVAVSDGDTGKVERHIPRAFKISAESRRATAADQLSTMPATSSGCSTQVLRRNDYGVVVPASAFDEDRIDSWKRDPLTLDKCSQDDPVDDVTNNSKNPDSAALRVVVLRSYIAALNDGADNFDDEAFERARKCTRGELRQSDLSAFVALNLGREYSNFFMSVSTLSRRRPTKSTSATTRI